MTKKIRQKITYLQNQKSFWGEIKKAFFIIIKRLSLKQVKQFFWKVRVRLQKFFLLKLNRFSVLTIHEITRNFLIRYVKSNTPIVLQEKWKNVHLFIFTRFSVKNLKWEIAWRTLLLYGRVRHETFYTLNEEPTMMINFKFCLLIRKTRSYGQLKKNLLCAPNTTSPCRWLLSQFMVSDDS